ncbi:ArsR/SmtB family transcription factor [Marinitoga lauensis]|uniref:ArsR/SmtB family transcription factor n=1 Tax=Marinitoga lauensis TaxID=2201189 RepID=UPI0010130F2C|nr:metalloregulator ArsR/SmtB family transcription factor [Marinitoga lauensis]
MDKYILSSKIFKALSSPIRLRIIEIIQKRKCNISKIKEELKLSQSSISQHIKLLEDAGIITKIKKENHIFCEIKHREIFKILKTVNFIMRNEITSSGILLEKSN